MYQVKSVARRLTLLIPVIGLLGAVSYQAIAPALSSADALNPLTKRSLLLTSSSPGWAYTDGSGDATYAPPGSGPNGQKTGQTFTFNTSTDSSSGSPKIEAFSLQYCVVAAGDCAAPGDDAEEPSVTPAGTAPFYADDSSHTDLNVVAGGANTTSYPIATPGTGWSEGGVVTSNVPTTTSGDFGVYMDVAGTWTYESGWTMKLANLEDQTDVVTNAAITGQTGANNYIILTNASGIEPSANEPLELQFQPNGSNYITNPGQDYFFVKVNDYSSTVYDDFRDDYPTAGHTQDVVDGGVTVAQVMNQSIEIQTKVLETMDFSVGTVDPDTLSTAELSTDTSGSETNHGQCDPVLPYDAGNVANTPANPSADTLLMGNEAAEYSLSTQHPYDSHSLFRVSTNAANGATVYYSGETLSDTEGNQIAPLSDNATSDASVYADNGTEQFGLGLDYASTPITGGTTDSYLAADNGGNSDEVPYAGSLDGPGSTAGTFLYDLTSNSSSPYWYTPTLSPLLPSPSYGDAIGTLAAGSGPKFAFNSTANTVPVPIATEDVQVVNCATGEVRYVADIAPSTPAGIYTTAINYLAAPEY